MMKSPFKTRNTKGNALAEYALPVCIVIVVMVVALFTMQSPLQSLIKGSVKGKSDGKSLVISGYGKDPSLESLRIQLADGTFLNLDDYPASMVTSIETVGADGTTEQYANVLKQLADQLAEKGETETANQLYKLSNAILGMAKQQGVVFDGLSNAESNGFTQQESDRYFNQNQSLDPSCSVSKNQCVPFSKIAPLWPTIFGATFQNGRIDKTRMKLYESELQEKLGLSETEAHRLAINNENKILTPEFYTESGAGVRLYTFYKELASALQGPYLQSNPALKEFVRSVGVKVHSLNFELARDIEWLHTKPMLGENFVEDNLKRFAEKTDETSNQTHRNGENVCRAGGGVRLVNDRCPP